MATQATVNRMQQALDLCWIEGFRINLSMGCMPLDEDEVARVRAMRTTASISGKAALSELIAANDVLLEEIGRGE